MREGDGGEGGMAGPTAGRQCHYLRTVLEGGPGSCSPSVGKMTWPRSRMRWRPMAWSSPTLAGAPSPESVSGTGTEGARRRRSGLAAPTGRRAAAPGLADPDDSVRAGGDLGPEPYLADFELVLGSLGLGPDPPAPPGRGRRARAWTTRKPSPGRSSRRSWPLTIQTSAGSRPAICASSKPIRTRSMPRSPTGGSPISTSRPMTRREPGGDRPAGRYLAGYPGSAWLDERFPTFARPGIGLVHHRLLGLYQAAGMAKGPAIYQGSCQPRRSPTSPSPLSQAMPRRWRPWIARPTP